MTEAQIAVRKAALRGDLDKGDPALLVPENFLHQNPDGSLVVWQEENGPIQQAARQGQLSYLPPEARTVLALFHCGHPLRRDPKARGTFEDAFFAAAVAGTLDKLPQDEQFKKDLLRYRDEVAASLQRAAKLNDFLHQADHGLIGSAMMALNGRVSEHQKRNAAATAWLKDLDRQARTFSDLPEVPSIPKDAVARAEAVADRARGGK